MQANYALGIIYLISSLFPLMLAIMVYRRVKSLSKILFIIFCLLTAWVWCDAFQQFSQSRAAVLFWHEMVRVIIVFLPPLLLIVALEYTQIKTFLNRKHYYLLFVLPVITAAVILTNHLHGFFRKSLTVVIDEIVLVQTVDNFWFLIFSFYSYILITFAVILILFYFYRQPQIYKTKPGIIIAGILIPTVFNICYDFDLLGKSLEIDTTSLTFAFSMIIVYYAIYVYKPTNVIPIARDLIVDKMDNPVILFDNNNITLDINNSAASLLQTTADKLIGRPREEYPCPWQQFLMFDSITEKNGEIISLSDGKQTRYFNCDQIILMDKKEKQIGQLIVLNNITELKRAMNRLEYLNLHDQLTGLNNRFYYENQLQILDDEAYYPLGIIMGDLNGLKLVNDAFGHAVGDFLLLKAAEVMSAVCEERHKIARIGGDEFAILLPNTNNEEMIELIDSIKKGCQEMKLGPAQLSISLGFASKTESEQDILSVMQKADEAMYKQKMLESKSVRSTMISTLQKTLAERNIETEEHLERTRQQAVELGQYISLPAHLINELSLLALLHDIGKLAIPDQILLKPAKLTDEEWEIMKQHSEKGYIIASSIPELTSIAEAILYHHEHWDGSGYPYGLSGEDIPLLSRIIGVVDAFDVMTHDRPYHTAINEQEALKEIERCSGSQFDPDIAAAFIRLKNQKQQKTAIL